MLLVALGVWQIQRLAWKTDLIAFRDAQFAAEPVPLPAKIDAAALKALAFRRVTVGGRFRHDREIYLASLNHGETGFRVITPLARDDGGWVLVDRGWIPAAKRDPATRAAGQIEGRVTIIGMVRADGRQGWFTPENDRAKNYWFWPDFAAMVDYAGVDAPPLVVVAGPTPTAKGPLKGSSLTVDIPNDHLVYAIIWLSLAVALAVIYYLSQRQPPVAGK